MVKKSSRQRYSKKRISRRKTSKKRISRRKTSKKRISRRKTSKKRISRRKTSKKKTYKNKKNAGLGMDHVRLIGGWWWRKQESDVQHRAKLCSELDIIKDTNNIHIDNIRFHIGLIKDAYDLSDYVDVLSIINTLETNFNTIEQNIYESNRDLIRTNLEQYELLFSTLDDNGLAASVPSLEKLKEIKPGQSTGES